MPHSASTPSISTPISEEDGQKFSQIKALQNKALPNAAAKSNAAKNKMSENNLLSDNVPNDAGNVYNFVVIGNPIAHSQSPSIHQDFAHQTGLNVHYARQYCPDNQDSFIAVVEAFFNGGGNGANVTVPFKQEAYQLCAERGGLSAHAQVAGAVNTLLLNDGKIYGDNTDGQGLVNHLHQLGWQVKGAKVAIIGAGGAARGVVLPLVEAGIRHLTVANRTLSKVDSLIHDLCVSHPLIKDIQPATTTIEALAGEFDLIINATSIGLSGAALPLSKTLRCHYAYDMMYGRELPFLQHLKQLGAQTSDGYGMLLGQAALSFERWTGKHLQVCLTKQH